MCVTAGCRRNAQELCHGLRLGITPVAPVNPVAVPLRAAAQLRGPAARQDRGAG